MKKMKKIFALVIAMIMVLGMSTMAAFAEETNKGTIKIENPTTTYTQDGETVTNGYVAYKIFSANPKGDGNDTSSSTNTAGGTVGYVATAAQKSAVEDSELFTFTKTAAGDYSVELAEGKTATDVALYFSNLTSAQITQKFGAGIKFEDAEGQFVDTITVDYGYYFVSSTNGSVVSVDTTNKNVVIADKNTYGGGDPFTPNDGNKLKNVVKINDTENTKDEDGNYLPVSASIGDVLTYQASFETTNYVPSKNSSGQNVVEKVTYVYVTDKLSGDGLEYVTVPATITVGGKTATKVDEVTSETHGTADAPVYAITYYKGTTEVTDVAKADNFKIVIPWLDADGNSVYADKAVVKVTYTAKVTSDVDVVDEDGEAADDAKNKAKVLYDSTADISNPPGDPENGENTGVTEDTAVVYVYALAISKTDASDGTKLSGAHFTIAGANGNIGAVKDATTGYYVFSKDSTAEGYTTDFESDNNGRIVIYGVAAGTYTATETEAPSGYNLLKGTTSFDAIKAGSTKTSKTITTVTYFEQDENGTYKKNDDGTFTEAEEGYTGVLYKIVDEETETSEEVKETVDTLNVATQSIVVENNTGTELPSTGGIGTTIFYIVGAILVIGAGVVLVTRRRMSSN